MRVLFLGDVVGEQAVHRLARDIPQWRQQYRIDLVIANIENAIVSHPEDLWCGFGISLEVVNCLTQAGVDVLTGGNHSWDAPHSERVMAHPQVLRPANMLGNLPGRGYLSLDLKDESVAVLNLMGASAAGTRYQTQRPFECFKQQPFAPNTVVIIDYHANTPLEKWALARALDGQVAAVMGTHTHEPTLNLHRLPGGTFFVVDVGMNGPSGGVLGMDNQYFITKEQYPTSPVDFDLASGPLQLGAVVFDTVSGEIERLNDSSSCSNRTIASRSVSRL